jgi:hypothetical protein
MTRRGSPLVMAAALAAMALAVPAGALDVELTYHTATDREFFPHGSQRPELARHAPPGHWRLPEFVSEHPVFTTLEFGDRRHLIALDKQKKNDVFYTRLYFDANANGDLTDDPVHKGRLMTEQRGRYHAEFAPIKATIVVEGTELPYEFTPSLYCYMNRTEKPVTDELNWRNLHFTVMTRSAYRADLTVGKVEYNVWLADSNGNGRFNDHCVVTDQSSGRLMSQGDGFFLAPKGEKISYEHAQVLGQYLVLGGRVFRVHVSTPASRMTLTPVTEGLCKLVWPDQLASLEVYDPGSGTAVMLYREGRQAPIPSGKYRLLNYRLTKEDAQGDTWQLAARGTTDSPVVVARADRIARFPLGEPFRPVVMIPPQAREYASRRAEVPLALEIHGRGGEQLTDLRHVSGTKTQVKLSQRNRHRPAEPTYKIIGSDGEVVSSGSFEYG